MGATVDMESWSREARQSARRLSRSGPATPVVILTLAFALGANAALFSLLHAVLLRPLPYPAPERLVALAATGDGGESRRVTPLDFLDWREQTASFEGLAAFMLLPISVTGDGEPETLSAAAVTPEFFAALGGRPLLGRWFLPAEGRPGRNDAAVLSHGLWRDRFGGDPGVLGRTLLLDGESYTVVGVAPAAHEVPSRRIRIYLPLTIERQAVGRRRPLLSVLGRLRPGVSLARARSEMAALAHRLEERHPETNTGRGARVEPLRESLVGEARPVLISLQLAGLAVLLLAAVNISHLLLAEVRRRRRELALRQALGAGVWSLARLPLAEGLLLALAGLAAGLPVAAGLTRLLVALSPEQVLRVDQARMAPAVLLFALLLALATGALCALPPALRAARERPAGALRERGAGGRGVSGAVSVVLELALTLGLLLAAGLLLRSLERLDRVPLGFEARGVLVLQLALPAARYPQAEHRAAFFEALLRDLVALPGARDAAAVNGLPLQGGEGDFDLDVAPEEDLAADPRAWGRASARIATPGYFRALGIPLLAGRSLEGGDRPPRPCVVVVNRVLARRFGGVDEAVGRHLRIEFRGGLRCEVVGVVGDTRFDGPESDPKAEFFWPYRQLPSPGMSVVVRAAGDPLALAEEARAAVWRRDREQPIFRALTMEQLAARSVAGRRFQLRLALAFGGAALLLAVLGVYAVMSQVVAGRRHEIGVRMALGASAGAVRRATLGRALRLAAAGLALGLALAWSLRRWLSGFLFGVSPADPLTLAAACLLLVAAALAGSYLPARRATRVDPAATLRSG